MPASLVLSRPTKSGAGSPGRGAGRGAGGALVRTLRIGEGCGDPLQNNVDGKEPETKKETALYI